jgi:hypothetical protein
METTLTTDHWPPGMATIAAIGGSCTNGSEKTAMTMRAKEATMFTSVHHWGNFTKITRRATPPDSQPPLVTLKNDCCVRGYARATSFPFVGKSEGEPDTRARTHGAPDRMTAQICWTTHVAHSVGAPASSVTPLTYQTARLPVTTNEVGYRI